MSGYGRPMQAPAGGEHRHIIAGLVLGDELSSLLGRQPSLLLPRLLGLVQMRSTTEQAGQLCGQPSDQGNLFRASSC